jgi:excisionase family DNA binding protein
MDMPRIEGYDPRHYPARSGRVTVETLVNLADNIDGRSNALTVSDVAELLQISERQVYKLAAENLIPSFKIGGSVRFDPATIAAWLRQKIGPSSVRSDVGSRGARRIS